VLLQPPLAPFELGVFHEVFGVDRTGDGVPAFDYRVCAEGGEGAELSATGGLTVRVSDGLECCADAEVLALPCGPTDGSPSTAVLNAVATAAERGTRILSVCTGTFTLAATGLLDGQEVCVHWRYADRFQRRFPTIRVNTDALYVGAGTAITSAGTAAGLDACLHLLREELGPSIANRIARRMVVAPHRDGGQRQFVEHPLPHDPGSRFAELTDWIEQHLDAGHTLQSLAQRSAVSPRTLLRRFKAEIGESPIDWLTTRRVSRAQHLLEATDLAMEEVARRSGFGSGTLLRHHFQRRVGIAPAAYRKRFRTG
jgi:transcriptional regulator GlxA family with amidase domain